MAVGSLGAIVFKYYNKNAVMISKNIMLHLLMYILLICLLFFNITDEFYQKLFLAILFLCTILSVVSNQFSLLNNKAIVYLGKISYGIYMYHFLVMYLLIPFANRYLLNNLIVYNIVVYILVFSLTIIISHFSYKYFESYFLRIKEKKFN
jgi:peptidoglycan/LPS O-acetylase OafA/YrhL